MPFQLKPGRRPDPHEKPPRKVGRAKKPMPKYMPPIYVTPLGEQVFDWPEDKPSVIGAKTGKPLYSGGFHMQSNGVWTVVKQYSTLDIEEFRRRIKLLGLSYNQFANRAGVPTSAIYYADRLPLHLERLLEFEELLAALADALDKPQTGPSSTLRRDVASVLVTQIKRLP